MSTIIAFILTLSELILAAGAALLHSKPLFEMVTVYGSPFYLIMNAIGPRSVLIDNGWVYPAIAGFHVAKYILLFRSQRAGYMPGLHYTSLSFEVIYLSLCLYFFL